MHQQIQRALREAKETGKPLKSSEGYARRGDLPTPQEILVNKQQLDLITLKIENLLNTNPRSKALPKLEKERDKIRAILEEAKASVDEAEAQAYTQAQASLTACYAAAKRGEVVDLNDFRAVFEYGDTASLAAVKTMREQKHCGLKLIFQMQMMK